MFPKMFLIEFIFWILSFQRTFHRSNSLNATANGTSTFSTLTTTLSTSSFATTQTSQTEILLFSTTNTASSSVILASSISLTTVSVSIQPSQTFQSIPQTTQSPNPPPITTVLILSTEIATENELIATSTIAVSSGVPPALTPATKTESDVVPTFSIEPDKPSASISGWFIAMIMFITVMIVGFGIVLFKKRNDKPTKPSELIQVHTPIEPSLPPLSPIPLQMTPMDQLPLPYIDDEDRRSSFDAIISQVSIPRAYTPTRPYHVDTLDRSNSMSRSAVSSPLATSASPLIQDNRPSPLVINDAPTVIDSQLISPVTSATIQEPPMMYPQTSITDLGLYPTYYSDPSSQIRRRQSISQENLTIDTTRYRSTTNPFEPIVDTP